MAIKCTSFRGKPNDDMCEFICDTIAELKNLPTTTTKGTGAFADFHHYAPMGSTCICGNNGDIKMYLLFSDGWKEV